MKKYTSKGKEVKSTVSKTFKTLNRCTRRIHGNKKTVSIDYSKNLDRGIKKENERKFDEKS